MNGVALERDVAEGFALADLGEASQSLRSVPHRPHADKMRELNAMLEALALDLVEEMEADPVAVVALYADLANSGHWRVQAAARSLLDRGIRAQYAQKGHS